MGTLSAQELLKEHRGEKERQNRGKSHIELVLLIEIALVWDILDE